MNTESQNSMATSPVVAQDLGFEESASTPKVYQWQYNGRAPGAVIVNWCYMNLYHGGHYEPNWYTNGYETIYFKDPKEYTLFCLRWS